MYETRREKSPFIHCYFYSAASSKVGLLENFLNSVTDVINDEVSIDYSQSIHYLSLLPVSSPCLWVIEYMRL